MKFTVYRDSWMRGETDKTFLFDGYEGCCLGHVANDMGVPARDIENNVGLKEGTYDLSPQWKRKVKSNLGFDWIHAADINDYPDITDEEREAKLIELFAKHGHELTFVEGKRDWK